MEMFKVGSIVSVSILVQTHSRLNSREKLYHVAVKSQNLHETHNMFCGTCCFCRYMSFSQSFNFFGFGPWSSFPTQQNSPQNLRYPYVQQNQQPQLPIVQQRFPRCPGAIPIHRQNFQQRPSSSNQPQRQSLNQILRPSTSSSNQPQRSSSSNQPQTNAEKKQIRKTRWETVHEEYVPASIGKHDNEVYIPTPKNNLTQRPPTPTPQQKPPTPTPQQKPPTPTPQQRPPTPTPQQKPPTPTPQQKPPTPTPQQKPPTPTPQQRPPTPTPQQKPPTPTPQQKPPTPQQRPSSIAKQLQMKYLGGTYNIIEFQFVK
ncbi:uncharacterized protein LOC127291638 [Leptopilina boulardi]|uniref:uncharacterized protein LOC127291638 n=1 Tax=Leptopilina boulardi TaxID=63433 RepID=UPI0021F5C067|nr:uncharacterized protein LOC127291638 [Leptopilina boulardi]